jgi:hypothetical protein
MVRIKSTLISAVSLLALFATTALSQAQPGGPATTGDPQLRQSLNELGYEYKMNDDGSALVLVPGEDGQPVPVVIAPASNTNGSYRLIMVPVAVYDGDGPANLDVKVQRISSDFPMGVLKVIKHNGKTLVVYGTVAPTSAPASQLGQILRAAAKDGRQATVKLNVA